jgi:hypothetical protein
MTTKRTDLLALTPDTLAALANRGLVKRAAKDLDAGVVPVIVVDEAGTVSGTFADGVRSTLPVGASLDAASCTCSAPGVCRHRVGLVLAYQREFAGDAEPFVPWSPAAFDDDTLKALFGEHVLAAASRAHRAGYRARVVRPTASAPIPRVELPSCAVRFLVPGELGFAETDATQAKRAEMITLAVWAFREADAHGLVGKDVQLDVGGRPAPEPATSGIESTVEFAGELLLTGAMHTSPVLGTRLRRLGKDLETAGLLWPSAATVEIEAQLDAYHERGSSYRAERLAGLLAELHARHRAVVNGGASLRSRVLGTDQQSETPLRRVRFTGLGCRVGGTGEERTIEVFLAHTGSDTVLVNRKHWPLGEDQVLTGHELANRKVARTTFGLLASGNVVTESAVRSASRVVRFGSDRVAKTTVTPVGDAWETLPDALLVRDLARLSEELGALPPRLVRPRVEAELVRVLHIAEVVAVGYHPGEQRLEAVIADKAGTTATISAEHRASCPGALDALAAALSDGPRFLSGAVHRASGTIVVDPIAVLTGAGLVVPDLAPGDGATALERAGQTELDPLTGALAEALAVCAEAAHRGLRHLPPSLRTRASASSAQLTKTGLTKAAGQLTAFVKSLDGDETSQVSAWMDAQIRLSTTLELRSAPT